MSKKSKKIKRGRPKGTPNADVATQTVEISTCPKCGNDQRGRYYNIRRKEIAGADHQGRLYVAVEWKRCKCAGCGQVRDDKIFVYSDPF